MYMARMLKNTLRNTLEIDEIDQLYSSFDNVGGIIIIKIPSSLHQKKN
jgi:tRNA G37 N-methylase Trm5